MSVANHSNSRPHQLPLPSHATVRSTSPAVARRPMPYETPDPSGRNWLVELPEEIRHIIFLQLDLNDITTCYRLCKELHAFLTQSAAINLRHTLLANSLHLNPFAMQANPNMPRQMPLTSAKILAHLRETLTRFRNVAPKSTSTVRFREPSGSLYEYLEGVLLRTSRDPAAPLSSKSRTLHVYDLRRIDEWEDTEDATDADAEVFETSSDSPMEGDFKTQHTFDFTIREVATDPTQDLLIIVSLTPISQRRHPFPKMIMEFHLYSLSTFEPHPKAEKHIIEFPQHLDGEDIALDFQICDNALYVLSKGPGMLGRDDSPADVLYGWEWPTGRLHVSIEAPDHISFESFVLLTASSFCVTATVARVSNGELAPDDLTPEAFRELYWTHHLHLYAFPPISDHPAGAPWTAQHVSVINMPSINNRFLRGIPPMQMSIRTDPPPRTFNSPYPMHAPPPYLPDPESGVAIVTFVQQRGFFPLNPLLPTAPTFTLIVAKATLAKLLPEPTSPLLKQTFSRPVPVVPFSRLAPDCRFFGPDRVMSCELCPSTLLTVAWVCFVYQNRYVAPYARVVGTVHLPLAGDNPDDEETEEQEVVDLSLQVFDFDQRRVRKEKLDRARRFPAGMEARDEQIEGDDDGIDLVLKPTRIQPIPYLTLEEIVTGHNMPYILVERATDSVDPLIDGQRILLLKKRQARRGAVQNPPVPDDDDSGDDSDSEEEDSIEVMEF
ncbi:hypothetical protein CC85DRAFT_283040 [Cutaneotrichosporon oleaginosum]|uniref:F-box domain-containing protein n=1 Tax=Cutaneotrichosporon oleaginosum TaxID=879819 RepID=A0A0J0XVL6_9TREE|nr:uncharacterized protein CC85DRAFT_283040 [Cutaneotrichosporon oleaginosum]KLT45125.1 hypothetical protein CC85DRAFT_283040 [Cutaneotrichosporon oleaginosum]TXT09805.1 hypothetical protein COLE_03739 [Cutaneotrichosporon oleaginosum]